MSTVTNHSDTTADLDPTAADAGDDRPAGDLPDRPDPAETPTEATVTVEGQMRPFPVDALVPHPDNPRSDLGDLTELARSIKAQGVLQPLLVLPAGDDGRHRIVAGHRRHAAAMKAGQETVPAIVRDLTPAEVIEAFLIENGQRSDLTVSEEVRAIERLVDLSAGKLTVARVCKRIGRSQSWVRTRMALCALPPAWREAIDRGDLSLTAGEAAASLADLGPEHVEALCGQLQHNTWGDHARQAEQYRARVEREAAYQAEVAKARHRKGAVVLTSEDDPYGCLRVEDFLSEEDAKAHRKEPCHAVLIERTTYGAGFERSNVCTDPERHAPTAGPDTDHDDSDSDGDGDGDGDGGDGTGYGGRTGENPADRGPWPAPDVPKGPDLDSPHLKRKGRLARLGYAHDLWARPRGGISQAQAVRFALRTLVYEVGSDALAYAADILAIPEDDRGWQLPDKLIDRADSPAALARIAAAVAAGAAETRMYHAYDSATCRDWMALLTGAGWSPDPWTATVLDRQRRHDEADSPATDDPADPGDGDQAGEATDDAGTSGPESGDDTGVRPDSSDGDQAGEITDDAGTSGPESGDGASTGDRAGQAGPAGQDRGATDAVEAAG